MNSIQLLNKAADNIRILAAAMVEKAKSGHRVEPWEALIL
jgi:transketolase